MFKVIIKPTSCQCPHLLTAEYKAEINEKIGMKWIKLLDTEAVGQRCSQEKVFWEYAVNLQENTYAEV